MTPNDDGTITLTIDDIKGIDALIVRANASVIDKGIFTNQTVTEFVRAWLAARR